MQFYIIARAVDLNSSGRAAASLLRHRSASQVTFVVPGGDVNAFRGAFLREKRVSVYDEREFAPAINRDEIATWGISHFPDRVGWYYQQFLKMSVAEHASSGEKYVIWDGDTVAFKRIVCFDRDKPIFTVHQKEFHEPYFETNNILIGFDRRRSGLRYSAVSQHMPVNKRDMLDLLALLSRNRTVPWWQTIRSAIQRRSGQSLFSEYELYHDYVTCVAQRPHREIERRWYRSGSLCSFDQKIYLRLRFDFASYEWWEEPGTWTLAGWRKRWRDLMHAGA